MFPLGRFRVDDDSMRPTLDPGDYVLVNRWAYRIRSPRAGEIVVLRDPEAPDRFLVKRISGTGGPSGLAVVGDNADRSRDSRAFGPVPPERIIGKVWLRLRP
ncbi:MAG TPA: nickel-type superoxide dismutase maturation protease [Thermoplasmata archaeon]|nr:nickel-type superoxide dismutase maturation protease [Thermoplasmata archaeon]